MTEIEVCKNLKFFLFIRCVMQHMFSVIYMPSFVTDDEDAHYRSALFQRSRFGPSAAHKISSKSSSVLTACFSQYAPVL